MKTSQRFTHSKNVLQKNMRERVFSNHYSEVRTEVLVRAPIFHVKTIFFRDNL
jgi:hypothetical protein